MCPINMNISRDAKFISLLVVKFTEQVYTILLEQAQINHQY